MKCQTCRDKDIELLSRYERFKNWLFYKMFPEDIADLSQNKYTQGFGDGFAAGKKAISYPTIKERLAFAKEAEEKMITQSSGYPQDL